MKYLKKYNENNSESFNRKVKVTFYKKALHFNGYEIDDITIDDIIVNFNIEIEYREWGIKSIVLYNITGPKQIPCIVSYYKDNEEDTIEEKIILDLDWNKATKDVSNNGDQVTVDNIEISLENMDAGNKLVNKEYGLVNSGKIIVESIVVNTFEPKNNI